MILYVSTTLLPYEEWSSLTTTIKKPQMNPIATVSKAGGINLDTNKFIQGRRHNYDKRRPDEEGRTHIDAKRPLAQHHLPISTGYEPAHSTPHWNPICSTTTTTSLSRVRLNAL